MVGKRSPPRARPRQNQPNRLGFQDTHLARRKPQCFPGFRNSVQSIIRHFLIRPSGPVALGGTGRCRIVRLCKVLQCQILSLLLEGLDLQNDTKMSRGSECLVELQVYICHPTELKVSISSREGPGPNISTSTEN